MSTWDRLAAITGVVVFYGGVVLLAAGAAMGDLTATVTGGFLALLNKDVFEQIREDW